MVNGASVLPTLGAGSACMTYKLSHGCPTERKTKIEGHREEKAGGQSVRGLEIEVET